MDLIYVAFAPIAADHLVDAPDMRPCGAAYTLDSLLESGIFLNVSLVHIYQCRMRENGHQGKVLTKEKFLGTFSPGKRSDVIESVA